MTDDGSTERFDQAHRPEHVEGLAEVRRPQRDDRQLRTTIGHRTTVIGP